MVINKEHYIKQKFVQIRGPIFFFLKETLPSEPLFFDKERCSGCFPEAEDGIGSLSLSLTIKPLEVDGEDFSRCLSSASLILFRSTDPASILDPFPPLYISPSLRSDNPNLKPRLTIDLIAPFHNGSDQNPYGVKKPPQLVPCTRWFAETGEGIRGRRDEFGEESPVRSLPEQRGRWTKYGAGWCRL